MHADHSTIQIIAHLMIAFLFLFRSIHAMPTFGHHAERFKNRGVPFPNAVLAGGFATMMIGGTMVALDFHAGIGAIGLIVFTVMSNYLYHDFWAMEPGSQRRDTHRNIFCNNISVMGGLALVIATS